MTDKTILVVDDEIDVLAVLDKRLKGAGYSIIVADNGQDAIALAKEKKPDLIILDILLPGMYGGEIAASLADDPSTRDIPLVFLSCLYSKSEDRKNDPMIAGRPYITKPYDITELLDIIEKQFEQSRC